ncbi:polyhydroxyalkanoate depolymerase [Microvirga lotononidis]|uniref:Polyhydroxyalkanoate depolymerase, intracellular n=1 Tax=Microvirga lotononidis TaxID=864069 RepID=I4Z428_9HYPH|nr:polyhydroxyalkanoate depolymerase [Microvirga lotononidis]EIM30970.1 polyhydroxyalkanoate depolymerase, intracellular [Microvirga lotononidis]WQO30270.1 polyhydroxyalkanoate depolymerase [Microvirga lotononidis]
MISSMLNPIYLCYETTHWLLSPARASSDITKLFFDNPGNPFTNTPYGRTVSAACELFERTTRRYTKPDFGFTTTTIGNQDVAVTERIVWEHSFCRVISFERDHERAASQPKLLIVAPMSGHYATLLRNTVETFLPTHRVMITDWADASMVPLADGHFDLDDYIDYLKAIFREFGPDLHVMAVCQPAVPVVAAIARLEAENDPAIPRSMILIGGPIDTRRSPTAVNRLAEERGIEWFKQHCIMKVPPTHPGFWRDVYPGFQQLSGFMAMNIDRHLTAYWEMFNHLVEGDGDSAEKHREFYDEYLAVMDLTAEFYLQTVDKVFVRHELPKGEMMHRDQPVDLMAVRRCAIMAIEGERDDISGVGQTLATLDLTPNLPSDKKLYHLQAGVGHYGVFNGSRFRAQIAPRIAEFIEKHERSTLSTRGSTTCGAVPWHQSSLPNEGSSTGDQALFSSRCGILVR